jgi:2-C-methyl-D-erythritol 4-phosphate cytidylyltransferase/2-C-methyl-D-erythritol 2,4-cyclodiphosphate synthase
MHVQGKTVALVVAGGSGSRSGGGTPKQYRRLAGKSVLGHTIDHLRHPGIDVIQVIAAPGHRAFYEDAIAGHSLPAPIAGGPTRQQSVRNGLEHLATSGAASVLIHDAARPLVPARVIDDLLGALKTMRGAVPVLPVADSLARGGQTLGDTVSRDGLVRVQTPQAFDFAAILAAHRSWSGSADCGDDAQVARAAGLDVAMVEGDSRLEKLTYASDFAQAELRLAGRMTTRTGMGFDVHAFAPGDHLWLGGVRVPHDRSLEGHSDADVVLHAITDALLGTIGDGDIGMHFPPSDPQWRGAASAAFLAHARSLLAARGGMIDHIDVTIICEAPRIGPYREAMRTAIAELLGLRTGRVSIKATTTERLGFTGRGEGMAAQAIATVRLAEES